MNVILSHPSRQMPRLTAVLVVVIRHPVRDAVKKDCKPIPYRVCLTFLLTDLWLTPWLFHVSTGDLTYKLGCPLMRTTIYNFPCCLTNLLRQDHIQLVRGIYIQYMHVSLRFRKTYDYSDWDSRRISEDALMEEFVLVHAIVRVTYVTHQQKFQLHR